MTDIATLRQRLLEAEDALHRLMIGELEVTVSVGGYGATTYAQTDINKQCLHQQTQIGNCCYRGRPRRGPLFMKF